MDLFKLFAILIGVFKIAGYFNYSWFWVVAVFFAPEVFQCVVVYLEIRKKK